MKIIYQSDDGVVTGAGYEGKKAVEEYENTPVTRFLLPWTPDSAGVFRRSDGRVPTPEQMKTAMWFFSHVLTDHQSAEITVLVGKLFEAAVKEAVSGRP